MPAVRLWGTRGKSQPVEWMDHAYHLELGPWSFLRSEPLSHPLGTHFVDKYPKWMLDSGVFFLFQILLGLVILGCKRIIPSLHCLQCARVSSKFHSAPEAAPMAASNPASALLLPLAPSMPLHFSFVCK